MSKLFSVFMMSMSLALSKCNCSWSRSLAKFCKMIHALCIMSTITLKAIHQISGKKDTAHTHWGGDTAQKLKKELRCVWGVVQARS